MSQKEELPGDKLIQSLTKSGTGLPPIKQEQQLWFWQRWFRPQTKLPDYKPPQVKHAPPPEAKPKL